MARPRKQGKKAVGIQAKGGMLYIVESCIEYEDGKKKSKKIWVATGLKDTDENLQMAKDMREMRKHTRKNGLLGRDTTMDELVDHFLELKNREVANTTYAAYKYKLQYVKKYFGGIRARDMDETKIMCLLDDLFTRDKLQPRTVKDIKMVLTSVMELAVEKGIRPYNPVKKVKISKRLAAKHGKRKNQSDTFFSYEEIRRFLAAAKDHPMYEFFYVTVFFALRREEALGLRWQSVRLNVKNPALIIEHTVTVGTEINRLDTTKTESSRREFPLTEEQVQMFREMKKKEEHYRWLCGSSYHDNDYVFKHEDGSLFYPDYPSKVFKQIVKANPDLPQAVTLHGLRKSCVSLLVHEGWDFKEVMTWSGHSDPGTMAKFYALVKEKEAKQEISKGLQALIKPAEGPETESEAVTASEPEADEQEQAYMENVQEEESIAEEHKEEES